MVSETRRQNKIPLIISGIRKDSAACVEGTARENFPTTLEPPPEKYQTLKIERGTLKNGADSSSFCQKAKVFGIHLVK